MHVSINPYADRKLNRKRLLGAVALCKARRVLELIVMLDGQVDCLEQLGSVIKGGAIRLGKLSGRVG